MARPFTRKRLIIGGVIVVVLAFTGLGFYWNIEPDPLTPPERGAHPVGWITTTQLINSIRTLLEKPGGYLSNDVMPPGVLMDNMPSWEYGALIQLRAFTGILRNQIARPQAQSVRDADLAQAYPKLNVDHESWLFPRDESSYHKAIEYLEHYRARLAGKEEPNAYFLNRPNNLDLWLRIVSRRLGALTQELEQVGAESGSSGLFKGRQERKPLENVPPGQRPPPGAGPPSSGQGQPPPMTAPDGRLPQPNPLTGEPEQPPATPPDDDPGQDEQAGPQQLNYSWLLADNYFYRARGAAWALLNLCRGIEIDFHDQLVDKQALDSFHFLEETLEASQRPIVSPIILSGDYFSVLPNHPLTMAAFMASANSTVINIRRLMIAD